MDKATNIRGLVLGALKWLKHKGKFIPVFDEVVNPDVMLPKVGGAEEVYVVMQDQQEVPHSSNVCEVFTSNTIVIRVVTVWQNKGSKALCEAIADTIENKLRDERGGSLLSGIRRIEKRLSRSIFEGGENRVAFSKVTTYEMIM